jgi:hypothetical protein
VDDTKALTPEEIDKERLEGMSEEMIQQEYYCSFEGVQVGAYYGQQLKTIEALGHMVRDLYEPNFPVDTWWDIGVGDSTAIWFTQSVGREVHCVDYLEASGEGVGFFAKELQKKPYVYGAHNGPADLQVREWGNAADGKPMTRIDAARRLGIKFIIVPDVGLEDGIEVARSFLSRCWFDKEKCAKGLNALQSYHKAYDDKMKDFKSHPQHDWSSHGADAFRYLAVGHKVTVAKAKPKPLDIPIGWNA